MKYLFLTIALFLTVLTNVQAQISEQTCHFGITFEISNNPNWGYGEPVVLTVEPNSPAEIAGIEPGDIIMEINGIATYLRNYQTINSWLFDDNVEMASFTVRNLNTYFKEYELPRRCRSIKAMDEAAMASSFSFYSLESTQDRKFTLPLKITTNKDVDYSDYHTFSFIEEANAPEVDKYINAEIEKVLLAKGLTRSSDSPDILVQTYYSYQTNAKYNPSRKPENPHTWRYNPNKQEMVLLPVLSGSDANAENAGQFVLEFGIRLFDQKYIDANNPTQMWEGNVKEYLTSQYTLEEYVRMHIPLILMQFPYSADRLTADYLVSFKKYNYTGLCFNMDNLKTITDVDRNSPAYNAGLRPGMSIEKINKQKFVYSKDEILSGYKRFIVETMKYRDSSTRFTDANGFPDCMYWNRGDYGNVAKAMKKSIYCPSFNYLYFFENYVSGGAKNELTIETKSKIYKIIPEVRTNISLRAL